jgi:hypothetical protein
MLGGDVNFFRQLFLGQALQLPVIPQVLAENPLNRHYRANIEGYPLQTTIFNPQIQKISLFIRKSLDISLSKMYN